MTPISAKAGLRHEKRTEVSWSKRYTLNPAQSVAMLTGTDGLLAPTPIDRFHVSRLLLIYRPVRLQVRPIQGST